MVVKVEKWKGGKVEHDSSREVEGLGLEVSASREQQRSPEASAGAVASESLPPLTSHQSVFPEEQAVQSTGWAVRNLLSLCWVQEIPDHAGKATHYQRSGMTAWGGQAKLRIAYGVTANKEFVNKTLLCSLLSPLSLW